MKAAVLSESPADEAVLKVLVEAAFGGAIEWDTSLRMRDRGIDAAIRALPSVITHHHYQTNIDLLVITVDSDETPVHTSAHDDDPALAINCRFCTIQTKVTTVRAGLRPNERQVPLQVAIGVAVPSLEAWLLHGRAEMNEAAWSRVLANARASARPRKLELKQNKYGADRPATSIVLQKGVENAERVAADLPALAAAFPGGFGPLYGSIRGLSSS